LKWAPLIAVVGLAVVIGFAGTSGPPSTAALEASCAQRAAAVDLRGLGKALTVSEGASLAERGAAAGLHVFLWQGDCREIRDTEAQRQCTTKVNDTLLRLGEKLLHMASVAANPDDETARTTVRDFVYKGCLADPNRDSYPVIEASPPAPTDAPPSQPLSDRELIAKECNAHAETNLRRFDALLRLQPGSGVKGIDLQKLVVALCVDADGAGIEAEEIAESISSLLKTPGINAAFAEQIITTAYKLAANYGGTTLERTTQIDRALLGGVDGMLKLAESSREYDKFSVAEIKAALRMQEAGRGAEAAAHLWQLLVERR
jgi:hypothetical protein